MKRIVLLCMVLSSVFLAAQDSHSPALEYNARSLTLRLLDPPQPVASAAVQISGNPGRGTSFYWIVTNGIAGASSPAGPFVLPNAPNSLSVSNYVVLNWAPQIGALSYDVLRTTSAKPPEGACNCAVATAVATTSANDQNDALAAYTVAPFDAASTTIRLTNESVASGITALTVRAGATTILSLLSTGFVQFGNLNSTGGALNGSIGATTPNTAAFTSVTAASVNGVIMADQQSGDACAKISAAIAATTSAVVDARGIVGDQTCTNPVAWSNGGVGVEVWLGKVNLKLKNTLVVGTNVRVRGWRQSVISADASFSSTFTNYAGAARSALVVLGTQADVWAPGSLLDGVWLDCNNIAGCIGVYSENIQERAGVRDVAVAHYDTNAVLIERTTNGSDYRTPQNYFIEGVWATTQRAAGAAADGVVKITGSGDQLFRWIRDVTVDNGGAVKAGSIGVKIDDGSRGVVSGIHCEEVETCLIPSSGSHVSVIDSNSAGQTVIKIPSGKNAITLFDIARLGTTTNTVVDDDCSLTLTNTTVTYFIVGGGTDKPCVYSATDTGLQVKAARVAFNASGFSILGSNRVSLASDFTTAANTNLQTVVSFTLPPNNALKYTFSCSGAYSQATAAAAVAFGIQAATSAPTNIFAVGWQQYTVGPPANLAIGTLATLTTTTATSIVTATPGATATSYAVQLQGTIENGSSGSAQTINVMVKTATAADAVTVLRGFECQVF